MPSSKLAASRNFLSQPQHRRNKSNLIDLTHRVVKMKTTRHEYCMNGHGVFVVARAITSQSVSGRAVAHSMGRLFSDKSMLTAS
jgi:hypothetical protein